MSTEELLEQALASPNPALELRSVIMRLNSQGLTKETLLERLERTRETLREAGRERDEDLVLDVMDFLAGWCSPHMKLRLEKPFPSRESALANGSPVRLTPLVEEREKLDYWLARPYVSRQLQDALREAQVVILPWEHFHNYNGPVFPNGTSELFVFLTTPVQPKLRVEAPVEESNYQEVALHAASVDLGEFMVTASVLPVFIDRLIQYINHRWPGASLRGPKDTIEVVICVPDAAAGIRFSFTGTLDELIGNLQGLPSSLQ